ncbi:hypothetical protein GCM10023185_34460 [Hymenobacter saemangeumensis]|uniref:Uncharacterized protein n=1 Tax=Hymenobacter saemangeumensis TaxID=1084522 RepID=A0ABP8INV7_9BACT
MCLLASLAVVACTTQPQPLEAKAEVGPAGEFGPADSLVYSPRIMQQLRHVVDSLNLRHKVCGPPPQLRSFRQGRGHYVMMDKNVGRALRALQQGMLPDTFLARFQPSQVQRDLLIISHDEQWKEPDGRPNARTMYRGIPLSNQWSCFLDIPGPARAQPTEQGRWVIKYQPRTSYSPASLEAIYFPEALTQQELPAQYARLVQYADCLIDTTLIYTRSALRVRRYDQNQPKAEMAFMEFAHQQTLCPGYRAAETYSEPEYNCYRRAREQWDSLRLPRVDALAKTRQFKALLLQAVADTNTMGASSEEFEEYVARYYSPRKALELKRGRRVVGGCSRDDSPRRHALGIARLSAETMSWPTFLRAHLDIMNDRFSRVSDGGYAQARRQTYLRELEELNINVPHLMLGIGLSVVDPPKNHYSGDVARLGRALAETRQPREVERQLLALVTDQRLDPYNRVRAYYLFLHYINNLPDQATRRKNVDRLNAAVQQLPAYLIANATVKPEEPGN